MKHIISILLENESGALSRVAGLFSARAYNIESLTVAPTDDPSLSRMTLVTTGTDDIVEQVCKQLNKLIDVVKLVNLTKDAHVERELILIKVKAEGEQRDEVKRIVDIFNGHVIDMTDSTYTLEVTGDSEKIDAVLKALESTTMLEVVRSGQLGMGRGDKGMV
ncbi:MAG: acetolactate synthase small subunit [Gammaproteobacteria bacterium]|nr:acetolactate synthase small subunit [Gammaproteobacteria bacterium]MBT8134897.1 acetolactate synthase small subunit [Gammaproteobacteria bacterium]NNJ48744.1 acetolactate synthase small subunit [Gammaproteobacteria bacterium]